MRINRSEREEPRRKYRMRTRFQRRIKPSRVPVTTASVRLDAFSLPRRAFT